MPCLGLYDKGAYLHCGAIAEILLYGAPLKYARLRRHIMCEPYVTTNYGIMTYTYTSEQRRVRIYRHIILEDRVTRYVHRIAVFRILEITCTECDALIEHYMIANHRRGTYHDARAVVEGKIFAYLCSRVYVDTGLRMCQFGNHSRQYRHT